MGLPIAFIYTNNLFQMSVTIKECADQLVVKFDALAKSNGKIDAKA